MKKLNEIFAGFGVKNKNKESHSCCGGEEHSHHSDDHSHSKTIYQCPMKCEVKKTYDAPGSCPVCNMHLTPVVQKHSNH